MMKKLCYSLILLLAACSNRSKIPSDVLSQEAMGKVMWDMIQADRFSIQFLTRDSSKDVKTETFKLYEQVFQLHKISREEFIRSYKFYLSRPDLNKVLFDSLASLGERQRRLVYMADSASTAATRKADSVTAAHKADSVAVAHKKDSIIGHKRDSLIRNKRPFFVPRRDTAKKRVD